MAAAGNRQINLELRKMRNYTKERALKNQAAHLSLDNHQKNDSFEPEELEVFALALDEFRNYATDDFNSADLYVDIWSN